jgi:hypothetical protein
MLKLEHTQVDGWEAAIRGMRNPMNSWEKSDSPMACESLVGEADLNLMQRLVRGGPDHAKFLRMIIVTCDITAPLYWWKEFDTYKIGTVANSCSTMHKIAAKRFERDDFSHEHLMDGGNYILNSIIDMLNEYRAQYLGIKDKKYWWQMIQLLPSSYNQKRTVQMNYQVLHAMDSRKGHKLDEWHQLLEWRNELPYYADIFGGQTNEI